MCFAVPYKIRAVSGNTAILEDGRSVVLGPDITARKGDYVRLAGPVVVDSLSKKDGDAIMRTIEDIASYGS